MPRVPVYDIHCNYNIEDTEVKRSLSTSNIWYRHRSQDTLIAHNIKTFKIIPNVRQKMRIVQICQIVI